MKICYFGAYDKNYSRNKINIEGLKLNNIEVVECVTQKLYFKVDSKISLLIYVLLFPLLLIYRNINLIIKGIILYEKYKFDAILVGYPGHLDLPAAFILKKIIHKPVLLDPLISIYDTFVTDRKVLTHKYIAKLLYKFEKILYKIPDVILMDTKAQNNFLKRKFNIPSNKVMTLYLGAEDKLYKPEKSHNQSSEFIVLFYGYASPLHGTEYIIRAAKKCGKIDQTIKFILLGDGQTRQRDVALASDLQLRNIEFLPSMKEKAAAVIIRKADIILGVFKGSPRSQRVIPNKVYQGVAMGKPVITEKSSALEEVFEDNVHICMCAPHNSDSLANEILKLRRNSVLRQHIAQKGYYLYKQNFVPKKVGESLIKIINSTVQNFETNLQMNV